MLRPRVDKDKSRVPIHLVLISKEVIGGSIHFSEKYIGTVPLFEVLHKLIPLGLKHVAPLTLLHIEVQKHILLEAGSVHERGEVLC